MNLNRRRLLIVAGAATCAIALALIGVTALHLPSPGNLARGLDLQDSFAVQSAVSHAYPHTSVSVTTNRDAVVAAGQRTVSTSSLVVRIQSESPLSPEQLVGAARVACQTLGVHQRSYDSLVVLNSHPAKLLGWLSLPVTQWRANQWSCADWENDSADSLVQ
jgi:hypothetical protein